MYIRNLDLLKLIKKKSFFLFGPRSTGKTTLMEQQFPNTKLYDLLENETFNRLAQRPSLIEEENPTENGLSKIIIIDEIQKLPKLLDEVHRLIKKKNLRFLLSGSSARKLKRGASNLLGGRAWEAHLFPLVYPEIPDFNLIQYLNRGGLPYIYGSDDYKEELKNYTNLYLREEIIQEGLVKKYDYFLRFLDTIALTNGKELNYEQLGSDAGVPSRTIINYVQILIDTLMAYEVLPFTETVSRKATTKSKLYLFDIGVVNYLAKKGEISSGSIEFGHNFEHFIINEIKAYLDYTRIDEKLYYWRTKSGLGVDCIIGKHIAIEIKSTNLVSEKHLKGLLALKEENICKQYIVISNDKSKRLLNNKITIYPWEKFLSELWSHKIIS
ncbi:MAG: ATP-binding protein [Oligoflexia bacterium]|nr:ATP-binding protein [Oligoflexia bacterium]